MSFLDWPGDEDPILEVASHIESDDDLTLPLRKGRIPAPDPTPRRGLHPASWIAPVLTSAGVFAAVGLDGLLPTLLVALGCGLAVAVALAVRGLDIAGTVGATLFVLAASPPEAVPVVVAAGAATLWSLAGGGGRE